MLQPSLAQATFSNQILSQLWTEPKESVPFPVKVLRDYHDDINYSAEQFIIYTEESWKGHFGHSTVLSESPSTAKVLTWFSYKGTILTGICRRYSFDFLYIYIWIFGCQMTPSSLSFGFMLYHRTLLLRPMIAFTQGFSQVQLLSWADGHFRKAWL